MAGQNILIVLALLVTVLPNCSQETETPRTRSAPPLNDDLDVSNWDFGEVDVTDSINSFEPTKQEREVFVIVVSTFTGPQHAQQAAMMKSQLSMQFPELGRSLELRQRSRGTVLTFGQYSGYDDPQAKRDMATLRSATAGGRAMFPQVFLVKYKPPRTTKNLHPYDLWTIRREFPTIVPIFTLEVAVWGDFDSGLFPPEIRRRAAEKYATELRKQGFEAFFYHNDEVELSSVTVGLFGHNAIDAETGFYSPEVDAMLSRFSARLVNGEEVKELYDPANPSLGGEIQPPCLAEVPVD